MTEVRLERPVRAAYQKTDDDLFDRPDYIVAPGSFTFDGERFKYVCPCGCKSIGNLRAGLSEKPDSSIAQEPTWLFNGDYANPTLHPSINHVGHWHGWLRNGWWEQA